MTDLDSRIRGLIETRAEKWQQAKTIVDGDTGAGLSADEAKRFDALTADINALETRIDELHELNETNKEHDRQRAQYEDVIHPSGTKDYRMNEQRFTGVGVKAPYQVHESTRKLSDEEMFWRDWLKGDEPQRSIEVDFSGFTAKRNVDGDIEVRDILTSAGSSAMVGTDIASQLYRHLVQFNPMLTAGARVLNTPHGRSVQFPKSTADGTAAIVGEGTAIAENDPQFGSMTLDAWKFAQLIQISNEMIQDAEVPIVPFIAENAGRALGLASGAGYMTGSGTNSPRGIITAVRNDIGTAVAVGSATVESDNLIDLVYSVSAPYRERGGAFFMNDSTAKAIRKLRDASGDYVWEPSASRGQPDTLFGYPVHIAPAMSSIGSANLSVGFGDPGVYQIRQAPVRFERSEDFAFSSDLVSFRSVLRSDGDLLDAFGPGFAVLDTD